MQALFDSFSSLGDIYTAMATAIGAADKVIKWIRRKPTLELPATPLTPGSCRGEVRLEADGKLHMPSRGVLAGSGASMLQCMNALSATGLLTPDAMLRVAFHNPLSLLGLRAADVGEPAAMAVEVAAPRGEWRRRVASMARQ